MRPAGGDTPTDIAEQEAPREDGSISQSTRLQSRIFQVQGEITAATADALQVIYDAMKAACSKGVPTQLWYGRDDRYCLAQRLSWTDDADNGTTYGLIWNIRIGFKAVKPFEYAVSPTTVTLTTSGGTISPGGNATAEPLFSVTIGTGGVGNVTITNSTTGESFVIAGTFSSGDVITVNRDGYLPQLNGVANWSILSGRIPMLSVGSNTIVASATTVTISALSVTYTSRYC
jgi:phage-related protein